MRTAKIWVENTKVSWELIKKLCVANNCNRDGIEVQVYYYNDKVLLVKPSKKSDIFEITRNYVQVIEWIE